MGDPQILPAIHHRPLSSSVALELEDFEKHRSYMNASLQLGFAGKQLAPPDLQSSLPSGKSDNGGDLGESPVRLKRNLSNHRNRTCDTHFSQGQTFERISYFTVLGCIVYATLKLSGMNFRKTRTSYHWATTKANGNIIWPADTSADYNVEPAYTEGSDIANRLKKFLTMVKVQIINKSDAGNQSNLQSASGSSSSHINVYRSLMPVEEAENLIKQWQSIKAKALGRNHQVHSLAQVLDESMLAQWKALADAAKERSCHWRFLLLQVSITQADVLSDGIGGEMAEIEALLEEAAELVDHAQQNNPNYYSNYRVKYVLKKQDDGSWKFCEGEIQIT